MAPRLRPRLPALSLFLAGALACLAPLAAPSAAAEGQSRSDLAGPSVWTHSAAGDADALLLAGDEEGAYALLEDRLETAPDDFEARWRAAAIAVSLSVVGPSHEVRRGWALQADAHGRELLHLRPDDPVALGWAAAARGRRALNADGMRTPAALSEEAWDLAETLLASHPEDPLGNHVLGKIHQEAAGLPGAARFFAGVFLGASRLGEASWEEAEEHHRRAVAGDEGMVFFYLDLGETYAAQDRWEEAADAWRRGLRVPDRYPIDRQFKDRMEARLEELPGR